LRPARYGLFERCDLGVIAVVVEVRAFAEGRFALGDDAAYGWIWRGLASGFACEGDGACQVELVLRRYRHLVQDRSLPVEQQIPLRE
jgi:hypothetical protein